MNNTTTTSSTPQEQQQQQNDLLESPCSTSFISPEPMSASSTYSNSDIYMDQHGRSLLDQMIPFPNSVLTDFTYCYSPTCYGSTPCYSYLCPKRQSIKRHVISAQTNQTSNQKRHPLWAELVSEEIYNNASADERKRQENIHELIYTESNYVKDLEYIEELWIRPLTETDIIPESRRSEFIDSVFSNILSIYTINARLATALIERQKKQILVDAVGDILLEFVVDFEPYIKYGARQHEAKYALEQERHTNPSFDLFCNETERHPRSHKLELNGYLTKPTTRLGRYTLLLGEILKRTPSDHPDYHDIPKAIDIIRQFLGRVNTQAGNLKNIFDLERLNQYLEFKHKTDYVDLELSKEGRVIIKQGTLKKTPSNDSTEYNIILLDHYLLVTKIKIGREGIMRYVIQQRPMALDLLTVFIPKEFKDYSSRISDSSYMSNNSNGSANNNINSYSNSNTINNNNNNDTRHRVSTSDSSIPPISPTESKFEVNYAYKKRTNSILPYVNVNNTSSPVFLRPLNDATYHHHHHHHSHDPSSMTPITTVLQEQEKKIGFPIVFSYMGRRKNDDVLVLYATSEATRRPWFEKIIKQQLERVQRSTPIYEILPAVEPNYFSISSKMNHIITFNSGQQYLLATDDGIYVGHTSGKKTPHKVLNLNRVSQIEVVESADILLVLSDRILFEYPLDVVNGKPETQSPGKRVQTHVPFFCVGKSLQQRTLVCVPRISTLKSIITCFEPISTATMLNSTLNSEDDTSTTHHHHHHHHNENTNRNSHDVHNNNSSSSSRSNSNSSILTSNDYNNGNSSGSNSNNGIPARYTKRKPVGLLERMTSIRVGSKHQADLRLKHVKDYYIPSDISAIELSTKNMIITSPRGMFIIDIKTAKPQQLLDPNDKQLAFVTEREREEYILLRRTMKHIAIFRTPRGDYFVCYDEYGFYIDGKGNRLYPKFKILWEGNPEAFACQYPYVIAFEPSFIEIRHIITGELEQIIRGTNIKCLNNGHKTEKPLIFCTLTNEQQKPFVFELQMISPPSSSSTELH
ncbi:unnamed protein product [Cunninghamella echinulata]